MVLLRAPSGKHRAEASRLKDICMSAFVRQGKDAKEEETASQKEE